MKITSYTFKDLFIEDSLRIDYSFISLSNRNYQESYSFTDIFQEVTSNTVKDIPSGKFRYCQIGDVDSNGTVNPVSLDFENEDRDFENVDYYKKIRNNDIIKVKKGDILISSIRPNLKKIIYIDETKEDIFFTNAFIHLRSVDLRYSLINYFILRDFFLNDLISVARVGKGYPTIKFSDLRYINFDKTTIDKIYSNGEDNFSIISVKYQEIQKLLQESITRFDFCNEIFSKKFFWDLSEFQKIKENRVFYRDSSIFVNSNDLRMSFHFNHPIRSYIISTLQNQNFELLKNLTTERITLGQSIKPEEYVSDGMFSNYYYVSMNTIKTWDFNADEAKLVTSEYYLSNYENKSVAMGDVIIARSGEAIGKTSLIPKNVEGIYADFTTRVRVDKNKILPEYFYYFTLTDFFRSLIMTDYSGLQNKNIYPKNLGDFPIPMIVLEEQKEIVRDIEYSMKKEEQKKEKAHVVYSEIIKLLSAL